MRTSALKIITAAVLGLAAAGLLSWVVAAATRETNLLSAASPEDGLRLAPGNESQTSIRAPGDKPVVVKVGPDGKAVVESRGSAPLMQAGSGSGAMFTRNSRREDD